MKLMRRSAVLLSLIFVVNVSAGSLWDSEKDIESLRAELLQSITQVPHKTRLAGLKEKVPHKTRLVGLKEKVPHKTRLAGLKEKVPHKTRLTGLKEKVPHISVKEGLMEKDRKVIYITSALSFVKDNGCTIPKSWVDDFRSTIEFSFYNKGRSLDVAKEFSLEDCQDRESNAGKSMLSDWYRDRYFVTGETLFDTDVSSIDDPETFQNLEGYILVMIVRAMYEASLRLENEINPMELIKRFETIVVKKLKSKRENDRDLYYIFLDDGVIHEIVYSYYFSQFHTEFLAHDDSVYFTSHLYTIGNY